MIQNFKLSNILEYFSYDEVTSENTTIMSFILYAILPHNKLCIVLLKKYIDMTYLMSVFCYSLKS